MSGVCCVCVSECGVCKLVCMCVFVREQKCPWIEGKLQNITTRYRGWFFISGVDCR